MVLRTDRAWTDWPFRKGSASALVKVRPTIEANDVETLVDLVRAGAGLTVLPSFLATDGIARGWLRPVLPDWTLPPGTAYVLHAPRRRLGGAAREILDSFIEAARAPRP